MKLNRLGNKSVWVKSISISNKRIFFITHLIWMILIVCVNVSWQFKSLVKNLGKQICFAKLDCLYEMQFRYLNGFSKADASIYLQQSDISSCSVDAVSSKCHLLHLLTNCSQGNGRRRNENISPLAILTHQSPLAAETSLQHWECVTLLKQKGRSTLPVPKGTHKDNTAINTPWMVAAPNSESSTASWNVETTTLQRGCVIFRGGN